MTKPKTFLILLFALLIAGRVLALDIYVGTTEALTNALTDASSGDVIWLSNGTYTATALMEEDASEEYGNSCFLVGAGVTIRSISGVPSIVILDANNIGRVARLGSASWIIGCSVVNGAAINTAEEPEYNWTGGGINGGAASNCIIKSNTADVGGGIKDCIMYNSTVLENSGNGGGARNSTFYSCVVVGNTSAVHGGGAYACTFYNSLIASNSASGQAGGARDSTLYNCTISGNSAGGDGGGVKDCHLYNCVSWGNNKIDNNHISVVYSCGEGSLYEVTTCITNDPLFIGSGDYRLQAGSPCIDTGTNSTWTTINDKDLDGNKRRWPIEGRPDMGAYEYNSKPDYERKKFIGVRIY